MLKKIYCMLYVCCMYDILKTEKTQRLKDKWLSNEQRAYFNRRSSSNPVLLRVSHG